MTIDKTQGGWMNRNNGHVPVDSNMRQLNADLVWFFLGAAAIIAGVGGFTLAMLPTEVLLSLFGMASVAMFVASLVIALGAALWNYRKSRRS